MDNQSINRSSQSAVRRAIMAALSSSALLLSGLSVVVLPTPASAQAGPTTPAPASLQPLTVTIERLDDIAAPVVGSKLRYRVRVVNPNTAEVVSFPRDSNLELKVGQTSNCRFGRLPAAPAGKYNCTTPVNGKKVPEVFHTVTEEDVQAGHFTPFAVFDITQDLAGNTVRVAGTRVEGPRVELRATPSDPGAPDPNTPPAVPEAPFTVVWARTDTLGEDVREGDVITWNIQVTSKINSQLTAFPRASNVGNVLTTGTPNCRYASLGALASFTCRNVSHRVSAEDVRAGSFTPTVTFDATRDREGTSVIRAGSPVAGQAVPITAGKRVDPATVPSERIDGTELVLGKDHDGGFACHRIPALTAAPNGWLLAAWDGRPANCQDSPQANSIVQRISKDGGQSWEPLKVIAEGKPGDAKYGYSDPSYVVDRETGEIFMFFVKSYDRGWGNSQAGVDPDDRNVLHAAVMKSVDNGETWIDLKVITDQITGNPATWVARFAASGEGIQKQYAPHKGRLIQQYTIREHGQYKAVSVYSDDHGETWKVGTPVGTGMDENKVVELENGKVMLNSRASSGDKARKVAISEDGGETYGEVRVDHALVDPRNNAAIIRAFPDAEPGSFKAKILLFTNAKHATHRTNGHVSVSFDNGQTWVASKAFDPQGMAYSTITHLRDTSGTAIPGKYGILYEEPYSAIKYMPISWEWLGLPLVEVSGTDREAQRGVLKFAFTVTNHETTPLEGATFMPEPRQGWEWRTPAIQVPTVAPGQSVTIEAVAQVGNQQNAGTEYVTGRVVTADQKQVGGGLNATFKLFGDQKPTGCLAPGAVTIPNAGDYPAQRGEEITKALDGNPNTLWHTPYPTRVQLPMKVQMQFAYNPGVQSVVAVPRAEGKNGKIKEASLSLIKGGERIELAAKRDIEADQTFSLEALKNHAASGDQVTLELEVFSTLGDSEANKWISLAELCVLQGDESTPTYDETKPANTDPGGPSTPGNPSVPNVPVPPITQPAPNQPAPNQPSPGQPSPGVDVVPDSGKVTRIAGESRVETAVQIAQADFKEGAEVVVIARADVHADSVSAAPLAHQYKAPILLTQPDALHPAVLAELKRLQPKGGKVILMGGEVALSKAVEEAVVKAGGQVERVAGANRAATAVKTAERLAAMGKAKHILVADGADWQPSLIAGPAAVSVEGVTLLTNGEAIAPETATYLNTLKDQKVNTIGDAAKKALPKADAITSDDVSGLSVAVAKTFFSAPKQVGVATTADFADALTGGVHIARKNGPLFLVPAKTPASVTDWLKATTSVTQVYVYGGETRISADQADGLLP